MISSSVRLVTSLCSYDDELALKVYLVEVPVESLQSLGLPVDVLERVSERVV